MFSFYVMLCACVWLHVYPSTNVKARGQFAVSEPDSGHQAWQQAPVPPFTQVLLESSQCPQPLSHLYRLLWF